MWTIYEHRRLQSRLKRLPVEILKRYEKWKDIVATSGPAGLRRIKGFRDEALAGQWKGHRCSRLGQQYRLLYRVVADQVFVTVIDINAHDYRRK
jgi:addiction module RelE/StbE family toxin